MFLLEFPNVFMIFKWIWLSSLSSIINGKSDTNSTKLESKEETTPKLCNPKNIPYKGKIEEKQSTSKKPRNFIINQQTTGWYPPPSSQVTCNWLEHQPPTEPADHATSWNHPHYHPAEFPTPNQPPSPIPQPFELQNFATSSNRRHKPNCYAPTTDSPTT